MIAIVFHYFQPNIRYTIHQPNIKTQPFLNFIIMKITNINRNLQEKTL